MEDRMAAWLAEDVVCRCAGCRTAAHVGLLDRATGRWTCYACGRGNDVETTTVGRAGARHDR